MNKKIIGIFVCTLMIAATVISAAGTINVSKNKMVNVERNAEMVNLAKKIEETSRVLPMDASQPLMKKESTLRFSLTFSQSDLIFSKCNKYDIVALKDFYFPAENTGKPMLPVKTIHLIIPVQHTVDAITFLTLDTEMLSNLYDICPTQPDLPLGSLPAPWVEPNATIYSQMTPYPGKLVEVVDEGYYNGNKIVTLAIHPLQWIPSIMKLQLYTYIAFELQLVVSREQIAQPSEMTERCYQIYKAGLESIVENDNDIPIYGYEPQIVETHSIPEGDVFPAIPGASPYDQLEYMIVTRANMVDAFHPFVEWLRKEGWIAGIVTVEDILSSYPSDPSTGRDEAERVKNCLKAWHYDHSLMWLLLGGDDETLTDTGNAISFPFRYGLISDGTNTVSHTIPTDVYFTDLNSNWDTDNDKNWGEPTHDAIDWFPQIYVGRVLTRDSEEVSNWTQKVLNYECNPGNAVSMMNVGWSYSNYVNGYDFPTEVDTTINNYWPSGFDHKCWRNYASLDTIQVLNNGAYGQICIYAHGDWERWVCSAVDSTTLGEIVAAFYYQGYPYIGDLSKLTNKNKYFVAYSSACDNAVFDKMYFTNPYPEKVDICIADAFTDAYADRGAVAFLGNTRSGYEENFYLHRYFLNHLSNPTDYRLGQAEDLSKVDLSNGGSHERIVKFGHNLFGSPETPVWTDIPRDLNVYHPSQITLGATDFTVEVTDNSNPVADASVCLWKGTEIYERGITDADGKATFSINPQTGGILYVTVTKHNYIPYQGSATVSPDWDWGRSTGENIADTGYEIAVDADGNSYITGYFSGTADFSPLPSLTSQGRDVFVAKLDTNGVWKWAVKAGGTGNDEGWGIALDDARNVYITGYFDSDIATFGTVNRINHQQGSNDVFVAKLDTNGNWLWALSAGGTGDDKGYAVAVRPDCGCLWITGSFQGQADFSGTTLQASGGDSDYDIFVATSGNEGQSFGTALSAGGSGSDCGYGIAMDPEPTVHDCYITGWFRGASATFGSHTIYGTGDEVFVAKCNLLNEDWDWAISAGGPDSDCGFDIAIDTDKNTYITGWFKNQITFDGFPPLTGTGDEVFVAKLNSDGNTWQWARRAGGPTGNDNGVDIALDEARNVYITGRFIGTADFGDTTLTSDAVDIFVAKLNNAGDWRWAIRGAGPGDDFGYGIALDPRHNIYITGRFTKTATFHNDILDSNGDTDVLVAKIIGNLYPGKSKINGPPDGKSGKSYDYTFVSTDPDDDQVKYLIGWGDGSIDTTALNPSGMDVIVSHTWSIDGNYTIRCKAIDEYGAEGDWATLTVTMPCSYNKPILQFLELLFQRFPHAFPILRHLLGY